MFGGHVDSHIPHPVTVGGVDNFNLFHNCPRSKLFGRKTQVDEGRFAGKGYSGIRSQPQPISKSGKSQSLVHGVDGVLQVVDPFHGGHRLRQISRVLGLVVRFIIKYHASE